MGCCTSAVSAKKPKDKIIDPKRVQEVKQKLKSEKMITS